jgi:hypothetical protein
MPEMGITRLDAFEKQWTQKFSYAAFRLGSTAQFNVHVRKIRDSLQCAHSAAVLPFIVRLGFNGYGKSSSSHHRSTVIQLVGFFCGIPRLFRAF